jgi:tRNA-dihydrouridine synthase B
MHNKKIKIGKIILKNPLILAPMVDVTDSAYRQICKKQGASLVFTQMLYTSQIINENRKTLSLLQFKESERPIGIQITGNSLAEFKACIPYLKPYDIIDINCGCPSIKITGNQAGSYLLKNPEKIASIIKLLKSSLPSKTITAKIRLGRS